MEMIKRFEPLSLLLVMLVALNWAVDAVFDWNAVTEIFGSGTAADVVYIVAGLAEVHVGEVDVRALAVDHDVVAGERVEAAVGDGPAERRHELRATGRHHVLALVDVAPARGAEATGAHSVLVAAPDREDVPEQA